MARAMQILRPLILNAAGLEPAGRAAIFRELAGEAALNALASGGIGQLKLWLAARHPELALPAE